MKILGFEFAPLAIPFSRRIQTFAVILFVHVFLVVGLVSTVFLVYLLFTEYYYITLLYSIWWYYDKDSSHNGGWTICLGRHNPLWRYLRDYFPIKLIKTADLDPKKSYLFGFHPHGVMAIGGVCSFGTEALNVRELFPGIEPHFLGLAGWFRLPITRELLLSQGASSVSRRNIDTILSRGSGSSVILPIGGAAEVLQSHPNTSVAHLAQWSKLPCVSLVLKNRKGFVRRALVNGASLVPVFSFGENELYSQVPNPPGSWLRTFQEAFKKVVGFYPPFIFGRGMLQYTFGYLPYRKPITVVVGEPIEVMKRENPTESEVDKMHLIYLSCIEKLFDEHKEKYGLKDVKMNFV